MVTINPGSGYVTFINVFHCRPEHQEQVVRINAEIIDQVAVHHAGFISATVHRSTDGTRVFNYLQWETAADLARMQASAQFRKIGYRLAGLVERFEPHQCDIVHAGESTTARPAR